MKTLIAALALTVAASTSVNAAPATHSVCSLFADIAADVANMRLSGMSQRGAANSVGESIGDLLSNRPGSQQDRQSLANLVAEDSTFIVQLVYSVSMRSVDPQFAGQFIYNKCMAGEL